MNISHHKVRKTRREFFKDSRVAEILEAIPATRPLL